MSFGSPISNRCSSLMRAAIAARISDVFRPLGATATAGTDEPRPHVARFRVIHPLQWQLIIPVPAPKRLDEAGRDVPLKTFYFDVNDGASVMLRFQMKLELDDEAIQHRSIC